MGITSMLNRPNINRQSGTVEYRGSVGDGEATVNQFGIHNHGAGMKSNLLEAGMDVATMIGGPVGLVANGGNAIRHAFKGNWGSALKSAGKGIASMIPGLNLVVGGIGLLKNGSDVARHGMGAMEQKMKGGYERQTQIAQSMFGMNTGNGLGMLYGGNQAQFGGGYGAGAYGQTGGYDMNTMMAYQMMMQQGGGQRGW